MNNIYNKIFIKLKNFIFFYFLVYFHLPVRTETSSELIEMRYCLKAIEYYLFLANNTDLVDYNNLDGKDISSQKECNINCLKNINLQEYFKNEKQKKYLKNELGYLLVDFINRNIPTLFDGEPELGKYKGIFTFLIGNPNNSNLANDFANDFTNGDNLAKIWLFFLITSVKYYSKIVKILSSKITSSKGKSNDDDVKINSSCTYFYEYYKSKVDEYKMILNSFFYYKKYKGPDNLLKYVHSNYKKVFIKTYKDILFIDFRREGTSCKTDTGFDQFPKSVF